MGKTSFRRSSRTTSFRCCPASRAIWLSSIAQRIWAKLPPTLRSAAGTCNHRTSRCTSQNSIVILSEDAPNGRASESKDLLLLETRNCLKEGHYENRISRTRQHGHCHGAQLARGRTGSYRLDPYSREGR